MNRLGRNLIAVTVAFVLGLGMAFPGAAAERKTELSVVYNAPRLSVEAKGVSLQRVLGEIGKKLGFVVVDYGASDRVITFSIQDASIRRSSRAAFAWRKLCRYLRGAAEGNCEGPSVDFFHAGKHWVWEFPADGQPPRKDRSEPGRTHVSCSGFPTFSVWRAEASGQSRGESRRYHESPRSLWSDRPDG